MRSINALAPFSGALFMLLAGCQQDRPATGDAKRATALEVAASVSMPPPHSPVSPGATGLLPPVLGAFSVITDDQQTALRDAGKAPCSVDTLNGSARDGVEAFSLARADRLEAVGWILNPRKEVPREFAIILEGEAVGYILKGIAGGPRPDVAKFISSESAAAAGYRAGAALAEVEPGTYSVKLAQDTYNVPSRCETGWVVQVTE